ncbi:hypothetical protein CLUG_02905 [Clavispora lusitaniae ATCC 42720]|uniref:Uncharacterized protein n=1 Tax=Clavispora lusitaniae (strain ATCC 42720) TaxID=306902 RepID=C4Y2Z2_CLAL4|nr:uncharacterized protein CLUG_02905 [Clavispora lusitaniae ATCC 42720]EEQ38779.1 hypothetical protein CLUG_02905 [Clavispora lusitaniae ATCC 42720]
MRQSQHKNARQQSHSSNFNTSSRHYNFRLKPAAAWSHTTVTFLCSRRYDDGTCGSLAWPNNVFSSAQALALPKTRSTISSRLSKMVEMPTESASLGTAASEPKKRSLASTVSAARETRRVLLFLARPASLKAKWPSGPKPPRNKLISPKRRIWAS